MLKLKDYLWENNVTLKGEYIGIFEYPTKKIFLGEDDIKIEIFDNYIKIKGEGKKVLMDIILSIIFENEKNELDKIDIRIDKKKIILDKDMVNIFKKINKEDYLNKNIYISKEGINWLKNISFYFISPDHSNEYYINKEIEKDLWR